MHMTSGCDSRSCAGRELSQVISAETMPDVSMRQWSLSTISFTSLISEATSDGAFVFICVQVVYSV